MTASKLISLLLFPRQSVNFTVIEEYFLAFFDWLASKKHDQSRLFCDVFLDTGIADRRGKVVNEASRVSEEESIDNRKEGVLRGEKI